MAEGLCFSACSGGEVGLWTSSQSHSYEQAELLQVFNEGQCHSLSWNNTSIL